MSMAKMFPNKDVVYTLVEPEWDEYKPTGVEKLLYIGTNFEASRNIDNLLDVAELRHRVYVDNELMFEASWKHMGDKWISTYDLLAELEKELDEAKERLIEVTGKLVALGQR
jgi:hypothetical protein